MSRALSPEKAKNPVALFVDDAHDFHSKTLTALERLVELIQEGGGQLSVMLVEHPKLQNDLKRSQMEEIGDRATVFEFFGLRDRQRDYPDRQRYSKAACRPRLRYAFGMRTDRRRADRGGSAAAP